MLESFPSSDSLSIEASTDGNGVVDVDVNGLMIDQTKRVMLRGNRDVAFSSMLASDQQRHPLLDQESDGVIVSSEVGTR